MVFFIDHFHLFDPKRGSAFHFAIDLRRFGKNAQEKPWENIPPKVGRFHDVLRFASDVARAPRGRGVVRNSAFVARLGWGRYDGRARRGAGDRAAITPRDGVVVHGAKDDHDL